MCLDRRYGTSILYGGGVALKGCAARTGKPASALDRDAAAIRGAMMPLWEIASGSRFSLTIRRSCEDVP